jgi:hypothetical protein
MSERRRFQEDTEARQRNILWSDILRNSFRVYEFSLKGSAKATPVQRLGTAFLAVSFLGIALAVTWVAFSEQHSHFVFIFSIPFFYLGLRFMKSAFRH